MSSWTMRLHKYQDVSIYPGYKLMCFIFFSFFKEQNALAFNRDTWCHLALCLQMIPPHHISRTHKMKIKQITFQNFNGEVSSIK